MVKLLEKKIEDGKPIEYTVNISLKEMISLKHALSQIVESGMIERNPVLNKVIEDFDGIIINTK